MWRRDHPIEIQEYRLACLNGRQKMTITIASRGQFILGIWPEVVSQVKQKAIFGIAIRGSIYLAACLFPRLGHHSMKIDINDCAEPYCNMHESARPRRSKYLGGDITRGYVNQPTPGHDMHIRM